MSYTNGEKMMLVGDVVKIAGVSKRTLQYYDRIGLLPANKRTETGYRLYDPEVIGKLGDIGNYKSMGYDLKEIREILYTDGYDIKASLLRRHDELMQEGESVRDKLERVEEALKKYA